MDNSQGSYAYNNIQLFSRDIIMFQDKTFDEWV